MACMRKLLVILNAMLSAQLLRGGSGWIPALVFTGGGLCAGITGEGLDDREGRRRGTPLRGGRGGLCPRWTGAVSVRRYGGGWLNNERVTKRDMR